MTDKSLVVWTIVIFGVSTIVAILLYAAIGYAIVHFITKLW